LTMKPCRPVNVGLSDLLDRLLLKGLVLHADLVITLAGIPLIGVNLRAAIAGMETMHRFGLMQDCDAAIRSQASVSSPSFDSPPAFSTSGAFFSASGVCPAWSYGTIYITDLELVIYHSGFNTVTLAVALQDIESVQRRNEHDVVLKCVHAGSVLMRSSQMTSLLKALTEQRQKMQQPISIVDIPQAVLTEECPQCGRPDTRETLLRDGCRRCGWQSPLKTRKLVDVWQSN